MPSHSSPSSEVAGHSVLDLACDADAIANISILSSSWEMLIGKFADEELHPLWKQLQNTSTSLPDRVHKSELLVIGASYHVDFEKRSQGIPDKDEYGFFSSMDPNYIAVGNDGYNLPAQLFVDFNDPKPWVLTIREALANSLLKVTSVASETNDVCKRTDIDISLEDTTATLSDLQGVGPTDVHQYSRRVTLQNLPEKKFRRVMIDVGVIEHLWRAHEERSYFVSGATLPSLPSLQSALQSFESQAAMAGSADSHSAITSSDTILDPILSPLLKFLDADHPDAEFITPAGIYYMKKVPFDHAQGVDKGTDDLLEAAYQQIEQLMPTFGFSRRDVKDYGLRLNGFERKYWVWTRG